MSATQSKWRFWEAFPTSHATDKYRQSTGIMETKGSFSSTSLIPMAAPIPAVRIPAPFLILRCMTDMHLRLLGVTGDILIFLFLGLWVTAIFLVVLVPIRIIYCIVWNVILLLWYFSTSLLNNVFNSSIDGGLAQHREAKCGMDPAPSSTFTRAAGQIANDASSPQSLLSRVPPSSHNSHTSTSSCWSSTSTEVARKSQTVATGRLKTTRSVTQSPSKSTSHCLPSPLFLSSSLSHIYPICSWGIVGITFPRSICCIFEKAVRSSLRWLVPRDSTSSPYERQPGHVYVANEKHHGPELDWTSPRFHYPKSLNILSSSSFSLSSSSRVTKCWEMRKRRSSVNDRVLCSSKNREESDYSGCHNQCIKGYGTDSTSHLHRKENGRGTCTGFSVLSPNPQLCQLAWTRWAIAFVGNICGGLGVLLPSLLKYDMRLMSLLLAFLSDFFTRIWSFSISAVFISMPRPVSALDKIWLQSESRQCTITALCTAEGSLPLEHLVTKFETACNSERGEMKMKSVPKKWLGRLCWVPCRCFDVKEHIIVEDRPILGDASDVQDANNGEAEESLFDVAGSNCEMEEAESQCSLDPLSFGSFCSANISLRGRSSPDAASSTFSDPPLVQYITSPRTPIKPYLHEAICHDRFTAPFSPFMNSGHFLPAPQWQLHLPASTSAAALEERLSALVALPLPLDLPLWRIVVIPEIAKIQSSKVTADINADFLSSSSLTAYSRSTPSGISSLSTRSTVPLPSTASQESLAPLSSRETPREEHSKHPRRLDYADSLISLPFRALPAAVSSSGSTASIPERKASLTPYCCWSGLCGPDCKDIVQSKFVVVRTHVVLQVHHSICDGSSLMQFLQEDLLSLVSEPSKNDNDHLDFSQDDGHGHGPYNMRDNCQGVGIVNDSTTMAAETMGEAREAGLEAGSPCLPPSCPTPFSPESRSWAPCVTYLPSLSMLLKFFSDIKNYFRACLDFRRRLSLRQFFVAAAEIVVGSPSDAVVLEKFKREKYHIQKLGLKRRGHGTIRRDICQVRSCGGKSKKKESRGRKSQNSLSQISEKLVNQRSSLCKEHDRNGTSENLFNEFRAESKNVLLRTCGNIIGGKFVVCNASPSSRTVAPLASEKSSSRLSAPKFHAATSPTSSTQDPPSLLSLCASAIPCKGTQSPSMHESTSAGFSSDASPSMCWLGHGHDLPGVSSTQSVQSSRLMQAQAEGSFVSQDKRLDSSARVHENIVGNREMFSLVNGHFSFGSVEGDCSTRKKKGPARARPALERCFSSIAKKSCPHVLPVSRSRKASHRIARGSRRINCVIWKRKFSSTILLVANSTLLSGKGWIVCSVGIEGCASEIDNTKIKKVKGNRWSRKIWTPLTRQRPMRSASAPHIVDGVCATPSQEERRDEGNPEGQDGVVKRGEGDEFESTVVNRERSSDFEENEQLSLDPTNVDGGLDDLETSCQGYSNSHGRFKITRPCEMPTNFEIYRRTSDAAFAEFTPSTTASWCSSFTPCFQPITSSSPNRSIHSVDGIVTSPDRALIPVSGCSSIREALHCSKQDEPMSSPKKVFGLPQSDVQHGCQNLYPRQWMSLVFSALWSRCVWRLAFCLKVWLLVLCRWTCVVLPALAAPTPTDKVRFAATAASLTTCTATAASGKGIGEAKAILREWVNLLLSSFTRALRSFFLAEKRVASCFLSQDCLSSSMISTSARPGGKAVVSLPLQLPLPWLKGMQETVNEQFSIRPTINDLLVFAVSSAWARCYELLVRVDADVQQIGARSMSRVGYDGDDIRKVAKEGEEVGSSTGNSTSHISLKDASKKFDRAGIASGARGCHNCGDDDASEVEWAKIFWNEVMRINWPKEIKKENIPCDRSYCVSSSPLLPDCAKYSTPRSAPLHVTPNFCAMAVPVSFRLSAPSGLDNAMAPYPLFLPLGPIPEAAAESESCQRQSSERNQMEESMKGIDDATMSDRKDSTRNVRLGCDQKLARLHRLLAAKNEMDKVKEYNLGMLNVNLISAMSNIVPSYLFMPFFNYVASKCSCLFTNVHSNNRHTGIRYNDANRISASYSKNDFLKDPKHCNHEAPQDKVEPSFPIFSPHISPRTAPYISRHIERDAMHRAGKSAASNLPVQAQHTHPESGYKRTDQELFTPPSQGFDLSPQSFPSSSKSQSVLVGPSLPSTPPTPGFPSLAESTMCCQRPFASYQSLQSPDSLSFSGIANFQAATRSSSENHETHAASLSPRESPNSPTSADNSTSSRRPIEGIRVFDFPCSQVAFWPPLWVDVGWGFAAFSAGEVLNLSVSTTMSLVSRLSTPVRPGTQQESADPFPRFDLRKGEPKTPHHVVEEKNGDNEGGSTELTRRSIFSDRNLARLMLAFVFDELLSLHHSLSDVKNKVTN